MIKTFSISICIFLFLINTFAQSQNNLDDFECDITLEILDANLTKLNSAQIGHWGEDASHSNGDGVDGYTVNPPSPDQVRNQISVNNNFIDFDSDRFFVRIEDACKNKNDQEIELVRVKVATTLLGSPIDKFTEVELQETDINTGIFISKSQLLVPFSTYLPNPDDEFNVHSGYPINSTNDPNLPSGGIVEDDKLNDRTHKISVFGSLFNTKITVKYESGNKEKEVPVCKDEYKKLDLKIWVFNEPDDVDLNNDGVSGANILGATEEEAIERANQALADAKNLWSQACIGISLVDIEFIDAPSDVFGVNILLDGVFNLPTSSTLNQGDCGAIAYELLYNQPQNYTNVETNILQVFFTPPLGGVISPQLSNQGGYAFIPLAFNNCTNPNNEACSNIGDHTFVYVEAYDFDVDTGELLFTEVIRRLLAHEIGHALTNSQDEACPMHILFPSLNISHSFLPNRSRRITKATESVARMSRQPGAYTSIGNLFFD